MIKKKRNRKKKYMDGEIRVRIGRFHVEKMQEFTRVTGFTRSEVCRLLIEQADVNSLQNNNDSELVSEAGIAVVA